MASVLITPHSSEVLKWAADLHRDQLREGRNVPYLPHVIAVSSLVWEDGGTTDAWYFKPLEHELQRRLQGSCSVERLIPPGGNPMEWALVHEEQLDGLVGAPPPQCRDAEGGSATASTASSG